MRLLMRIKKIMTVALLGLTILLSGCSYSQTGIDSLLTPPKLSDQQNEIYAALEASVGKNIKLKYPRRGDFTSAFLINNIDNEPTQEAIVFFENTAANASVSMPLRVNVLDQQDGKWVSKYELGVEANEVDKVSFVSSNQQLYMIIGYTLLSKSEKMVAIYTYAEGVLNPTASLNCTDYVVADIDGDSASEIVAFSQSKGEREAKTTTAVLHRIISTGTAVLGRTHMDPNVTSYANIQNGKLRDGRSAIYIDGLKGTNMLCTEILTYSDRSLENLTYSPESETNLVDQTLRTYGSLCLDLNRDGVFEIPALKPSPGYEELPPLQQQYLTEWYNLGDKELSLYKTTYVSYSLGYIFTLPHSWVGNVKIDFNANDNELSFYDYSMGDANDARLASIKVIQRNQYEGSENKGYSLLKDNGQLVYTYKIYESTSEIRIWPSTMQDGFSLLQN